MSEIRTARPGWGSDSIATTWCEDLADDVAGLVEWILWTVGTLPADTYEP